MGISLDGSVSLHLEENKWKVALDGGAKEVLGWYVEWGALGDGSGGGRRGGGGRRRGRGRGRGSERSRSGRLWRAVEAGRDARATGLTALAMGRQTAPFNGPCRGSGMLPRSPGSGGRFLGGKEKGIVSFNCRLLIGASVLSFISAGFA
jgi:hypothetical protein